MVEKTIEAEIRPEEQSEKAESCREYIYRMKYSWKGPKNRIKHKK